jgi:hypothetical protein
MRWNIQTAPNQSYKLRTDFSKKNLISLEESVLRHNEALYKIPCHNICFDIQ